MKKTIFLILGLVVMLPVCAQKQDKELFNHVSLGVSLGTDGIGIEAATPIGHYVQTRVGVGIMPKFSYSDDVHIYTSNTLGDGMELENTVKAKGVLHNTTFKWLFDIYPSKHSAFHFTTGFFLANENVVKGKNTTTDPLLKHGGAILIGGQPFGANQAGIANVRVRANSFRPYVGIGFGRAVPKKHRFAITCDLGMQLWGKPKVYAYNDDILHGGMKEVRYQDIDKNSSAADCRDAIRIANGIFAWPVINIRLNGKIF